jgi:hypothetical protein
MERAVGDKTGFESLAAGLPFHPGTQTQHRILDTDCIPEEAPDDQSEQQHQQALGRKRHLHPDDERDQSSGSEHYFLETIFQPSSDNQSEQGAYNHRKTIHICRNHGWEYNRIGIALTIMVRCDGAEMAKRVEE